MKILLLRRAFKICILVCMAFVHQSGMANEVLPVFPGSTLEYTKQSTLNTHQVLLSTPKRISNSLSIESQEDIAGSRENRLLRLADNALNSDVLSFYESYLKKNGQVLYVCEKRACGSSNYWANRIFSEHKLYGRDSDQVYLAGKVEKHKQTFWVTVYGVRNGLKQNLVFLSVVTAKSSRDGREEFEEGVLLLNGEIAEGDISRLGTKLNLDETLHVYLVAYSLPNRGVSFSRSESELNDAVSKTQQHVQDALQLDSSRVHTRVVGPFASVEQRKDVPVWYRIFLLKP